MALASCRECQAQVSTEAAQCPKCGVSDPTGAQAAQTAREQRVKRYFFAGLFALVLIFAVINQFGSHTSTSTIDPPTLPSTDSTLVARADSIMSRVPIGRVAKLSTDSLDMVVSVDSSSNNPKSAAWLATAEKERARRAAAARLAQIQLDAFSVCQSRHSAAVAALALKHPDWSDDAIAIVACHRVVVGMSQEQLLASWGRPEQVNRTVVGSSASDQLVYSDNNYVYIENGVVTSYQTSR
jgi:hypothetical protein